MGKSDYKIRLLAFIVVFSIWIDDAYAQEVDSLAQAWKEMNATKDAAYEEYNEAKLPYRQPGWKSFRGLSYSW